MKSRITRFIFTRLGFALVLAVSFTSIAATAQAARYVDQVLPTLCKSSQLAFIGDNTEYNDTSIGVRPSESLWDFDIVMCPINRFRLEDDIEAIKILFRGDRAASGWCRLYSAGGYDSDREVDFQWVGGDPGGDNMVYFEPPGHWARNGMLSVTAECLMFPGTSITAIELIWVR